MDYSIEENYTGTLFFVTDNVTGDELGEFWWSDGYFVFREVRYDTMDKAAKAVADHVINAVKAGATALDSNVPNWFERVNIDTLNMTMVTTCIVGQVFGVQSVDPDSLTGWDEPRSNYNKALNDLIGDHHNAENYGFDGAGLYKVLRNLWTEEVNNRV